MTANECRPPAGTAELTYHWIRREVTHPARWVSGGWQLCGYRRAIAHDEVQHWRYIGPCVPPEVEG